MAIKLVKISLLCESEMHTSLCIESAIALKPVT